MRCPSACAAGGIRGAAWRRALVAVPRRACAFGTVGLLLIASRAAAYAEPGANDEPDAWYSSGLFGTDPREPVYLPIGVLISWPFEHAVGIGAEATLDIYHQREWHWGLVAQAEYDAGAGADSGHFALGPQLGVPYLGVELAGALRTGTPQHATSLLPQLAPYASAGFASVALRISGPGLALGGSADEAWPAALAFVVTLKWPISLQSDLYCSGSALYCMPGAPRPPP